GREEFLDRRFALQKVGRFEPLEPDLRRRLFRLGHLAYSFNAASNPFARWMSRFRLDLSPPHSSARRSGGLLCSLCPPFRFLLDDRLRGETQAERLQHSHDGG